MIRYLPWILPAVFLTLAAVYAVAGRLEVAALYALLALGVWLHGLGARKRVAPLQWFGAGISGFVLVVLLWMAFGT